MMSPAKVILSQKELELINNTDWILTKNAVIRKVYLLFGELSNQYRTIWNVHQVPALKALDFPSPKIARGDQYEGLPWLMLDYPRYFTKDNTLAIRSFFWWGKGCSITIQLSGIYQKKYALAFQNYLSSLKEISQENNWLVGIGTDPWQHHFREDNYRRLDEMNGKSFIELPFLKLTKKIPLAQWDDVPDFFENTYTEIIKVLSSVVD